MNKQQLWDFYCNKNPDFNYPEAIIKLTGKGLKKFFDQTYDYAYNSGKSEDEGANMFNSLFGGSGGFKN